MQTSGFFDAMEVGNGQYDREYVAAQFAKYFSLFVGNGVFLQTANALQIVSAGDMDIIMHAGAAFVNGYWYINDSDLIYTIPINTESTARYDSVVIAFDTVERTAEMRYKVNDISVVREDEIYELQIAQVVVNAGTVEITDAYIIDKRPDENVCGFVKGLVEVLTTNELFNQFNAQFAEWFDVIKGQLSEDAAGNLQLQVDERVLKSNVVKTAEEIENGTDEEKVAGILAIKGLLQKINNSINERVLKSKVLSQLALVINATSEEEVAGALAVKELNSNVDELNKNIADNTNYIRLQSRNSKATNGRHLFYGEMSGNGPKIGYDYCADPNNATTRTDYVKVYFDGENFYAEGKKAGADAVLKKLGKEPITIPSLKVFRSGGSTFDEYGDLSLEFNNLSEYELLSIGSYSVQYHGAIRIYLDGTIKKTFSGNTSGSDYTLNISSASKLKIEMSCGYGDVGNKRTTSASNIVIS